MNSPQHPIWRLLTLVVLLSAVGGYMHVFYANGIDPLKDGTLLTILGGLAVAWNKFTGGGSQPDKQ